MICKICNQSKLKPAKTTNTATTDVVSYEFMNITMTVAGESTLKAMQRESFAWLLSELV